MNWPNLADMVTMACEWLRQFRERSMDDSVEISLVERAGDVNHAQRPQALDARFRRDIDDHDELAAAPSSNLDHQT